MRAEDIFVENVGALKRQTVSKKSERVVINNINLLEDLLAIQDRYHVHIYGIPLL